MARDTEDLLARLEQFVPDALRPLRPLLAGEAAVLAVAEGFAETCVDAAWWAGAEGAWLSLHARSQGTQRRSGEADADLRVRLQTTEAQLTPPALLEGVQALMAPYTTEEALLIEWWQGPYLDHIFLDDDPFARLSPGPHGLLVLLPAAVGEAGWGDAHLDSVWLDDAVYLGIEEADIIGLIAAEVARRRAAGVRAWVVVMGA